MASGSETKRLTVVGTRITQGNAVDCPHIRGEDGTVTAVSYLAPSIAIGTRIKVTGFLAHVTHCRGEVLNVEEVSLLDSP